MKNFDSINVIPFIDIMLVLLAIVLTTATFINNGQLNVRVPASSAAQPGDAVEAIEIAIDQAHQYYLAGELSSIDLVEAALQDSERTMTVRLRVDEASEFRYFVNVIDLLKRYRFDNVAILTRTVD